LERDGFAKGVREEGGEVKKAQVVKAPDPFPNGRCDLFLSGSIDMGNAPHWRKVVIEFLRDLPIVIANPRRDDWDSTWIQSINCKQFREQVLWELDAMEKARMIGVYFAPDTYAPITLLEMGLFAHSDRLVVCCPNGFYRKGNIEIVTFRYGIPFYQSMDRFIAALKRELRQ
jgi:hypothetical protein